MLELNQYPGDEELELNQYPGDEELRAESISWR